MDFYSFKTHAMSLSWKNSMSSLLTSPYIIVVEIIVFEFINTIKYYENINKLPTAELELENCPPRSLLKFKLVVPTYL